MNDCPIALIGYGSMGKELERLAPQYGCRVEQIFTSATPLTSAPESAWNFDVAIDFSKPHAVQTNVAECARRGKNIVIGTTGWTSDITSLRELVATAGIGAVWGANFSVGVLMFMRIVEEAARLVARYDEYDVALHELHHRRKLDSPSGTGLALGEILMQHTPKKPELLTETSHGRIAETALHLSSTRVGEIPGTHTVYLDSLADTLELTHRARNRSGFALGALRAARWLRGKQGFFEVREVFQEF